MASPVDDYGNQVVVDCRRCGFFRIGEMAVRRLESDQVPRGLLSAWIRDHREFGRQPPTILNENLEGIVGALPDYRVADKQRLLLAAIERRTNPAETTKLVFEEDYPVAWSENGRELRYLLNALGGRGLINLKERAEDAACEITPKGWDYLDEVGRKRVGHKQVFAAMSFDASMDEAWSMGIKPALESVGYRPYRVDMEQHVDRIDAKIVAEIKASKFIVAGRHGTAAGGVFRGGVCDGARVASGLERQRGRTG